MYGFSKPKLMDREARQVQLHVLKNTQGQVAMPELTVNYKQIFLPHRVTISH